MLQFTPAPCDSSFLRARLHVLSESAGKHVLCGYLHRRLQRWCVLHSSQRQLKQTLNRLQKKAWACASNCRWKSRLAFYITDYTYRKCSAKFSAHTPQSSLLTIRSSCLALHYILCLVLCLLVLHVRIASDINLHTRIDCILSDIKVKITMPVGNKTFFLTFMRLFLVCGTVL